MFDRFTEKARDVVHYARIEASLLGSSTIEPEHLLLSLLKADETLSDLLPAPVLRGEMLQLLQSSDRRGKQDLEIPLSHSAKRALAYGAEEAERLNHQQIVPAHLTLGLLRLEECAAADLLRQHGVDSASYRTFLRKEAPLPPTTAAEVIQAPLWVREAVTSLETIVGKTRKHLKRYADVYGETHISSKSWTRKQAMGHLVDVAAAHHIWFACALTQAKLVAGGYPHDDWVSGQKYEHFVWQELVDLWVSLNRQLIYVLAQIPEAKREMECRIGARDPIPLTELIARYVKHCGAITTEIMS
ncbi:MAG TPA: Clp protease N-terminal domain-containing protein [Bryobacteraceae bacterium]|nr:Clp protease N-terminal domain-containing protein [Bryobacteraceae bacterium]